MKITLTLPEDVEFPTLTAAPSPEGILIENLRLMEDGRPVPCHIEVVHREMDGSPVWLHIYARYIGGREYTLVSSTVPRPILSGEFANIPAWCIEARDHRKITWKIDSIRLEDVIFELNNALVRTFYYEGWLNPASNTQTPPFLRFKLRITQFAGSPFIKFDCSVIMADKMAENRIEYIRIRFPELGASEGSTVRTMLDGQIRALDAPALIHQSRFNKTNIPGSRQADGVIETGGYTLCVRNFWQKYPQALATEQGGLSYYQWYGRGTEFTSRERLQVENLHKLYHWHHGRFLTSPAPADWVAAMDKHLENKELQADFMAGADMQGISFHDDFCLYAGTEIDLENLQTLWQENHVGRVQEGSQTRLYGMAIQQRNLPELERFQINDFQEVETFMEKSILSYTDPSRFEAYGRFLYGESFRVININENRPVLHRMYLGSYYSAGETYWRQYLRTGSKEILQLARRNTERYRAILQTSYDRLRGQKIEGQYYKQGERPETKFHNPGGFWLRGHWWGPDYGMETRDNWQSLAGRGADPDSLLLSYLTDGNRFHYDGYLLWYKNMVKKDPTGFVTRNDFLRGSNAREVAKSLGACVTAYEHFRDPALLENIKGMAHGMMRNPFASQLEPLWYPEWPNRVYKYLHPADQNKLLEFLHHNYDSSNTGNVVPLSAAALSFTHDSDVRKYIKPNLEWIMTLIHKVVKEDREPEWQNFGIGDGPLGDAFLKLQWPTFLKSIQLAHHRLRYEPELKDSGMYPWSTTRYYNNSIHEVQSRGGQILINKTDNEPLVLNFDFLNMGLSGGSTHGGQIWIQEPGREFINQFPLLNVKESDGKWGTKKTIRIGTKTYKRYTLTFERIQTGIVTVYLAGHQMGMYGPISNYPEVMVLKPNSSWGTDGGITYWLSDSNLLFRPLESNTTLSIKAHDKPRGGFIRINGITLKSKEETSIPLEETTPMHVLTLGAKGACVGILETDKRVIIGRSVSDLDSFNGLV
ncbi:hypothetical protein M3O96_00110 [Aquiflexum sp. TKW24L]|uniref:hypothetical protein n=1 Tax=Aquiflexum sp. TKW24L TaxID=2942212 RepID=UPI0020BFEF47|nr:hypothetical protein [Aquiflexum sp. TKW24L]MCL6257472.1 hypothetical protein [Aquiflexum sp. TKW24L]